MQTEANEYRLHDPNEHKYDDGLTRFIDENDLYDEISGNVESPTGWFGRAGKNIIQHDNLGFVSRWRAQTERQAKDQFEAMNIEYCSWDDEEEEEEEIGECPIHAGYHHEPGSFVCEVRSSEVWGGTC